MFVHNTEPRLFGLNTKECSVKLMPGVNQVDDEQWAKVKDMKLVKHLLASGSLKIAEPAKEKGQGKAQSIKEMNAGEAIKLVDQTLDEALLAKFAGEEDRKSVVDAIEKQFKKLEEAGKKEQKE